MLNSHWYRDGHTRVALVSRWPCQTCIGIEMAIPELYRYRDGRARVISASRWPCQTCIGIEMAMLDLYRYRDGYAVTAQRLCAMLYPARQAHKTRN